MQTTIPFAYQQALEKLAECWRECYRQAQVLDHFAGMLRGDAPEDSDQEITPQLPSNAQVWRTLEQRDQALDVAQEAYRELSPDERDEFPPPEAFLEGLE